MARRFVWYLVAAIMLTGIHGQEDTSGSSDKAPTSKQGSLRLPDGTILVPFGRPGNNPGAQLPYPGYPPQQYPNSGNPYFPPQQYPNPGNPYYPPQPYPGTGNPYVPPQPYPGPGYPYYPPQQYQDPYYGLPMDPYYPQYDSPDQSSGKKKGSSNNVLLVLLLTLMNSAASTTATPTTTADPGDCTWGPWSTCDSVCRGQRKRERMCQGKTQMESEICNTMVGFLADGLWYRAKNCYDYRYFTETNTDYTAAETRCTDNGARLASTGLRDDEVRLEILTAFATHSATSGASPAYVGVTDRAVPGTYVWSDGVVEDPTFWAANQPIDPDDRCATISVGDPVSLNDVECDATETALCEKKSA